MPSECTGCCRYLKDLPKKVEGRACQHENGFEGIVMILGPAKCVGSTSVKLDIFIQMFPRT